jgi:hypothetical protein
MSETTRLDPLTAVQTLLANGEYDPQRIADSLLNEAYRLDSGRPRDDISVLVVSVLEKSGDDIRRMSVRFPLA